MNSEAVLKEVGKNLRLTIQDLEQFTIPQKKTLDIQEIPTLVDIQGLVVDGYDESLFNDIQQKKIPIDAWGFRQWEQLWKDVYIYTFQKKYPYSRQQFNNVFSDFLHEVKDGYNLSNEEIAKYFYWFSRCYLAYLDKHNKPFNFRSLKYKLGEFYNQEIKPLDVKQGLCGKRLRDVYIDPKDLKGSIEAEYEKNCDVLIRQLGLPIMLFYNIKWVHGEHERSLISLVECVKERCKFEKSTNGSYCDYVSQIIYNSIYFGPYPFEDKLFKMGFKNWRTVFDKFIKETRLTEIHWWLNCYMEREPLECVKIFSRKHKIIRKSR